MRISELPTAEKVNKTDKLVMVQGGVTKQVNAELVNSIDGGDTLAIGTGSIFSGMGTSATALRFTIPVAWHISASSVSISGSFRALHDGTSSGYLAFDASGTTITTELTDFGINVLVQFSTSPSWLSANMNYAVNLSNATITFS